MKKYVAALATICVFSLLTAPAAGVQIESCKDCHGDEMLVGVLNSVDLESYERSIHAEAGIECVDCHSTLSDVEDFPHDNSSAKVDCSMCHDSEFEDYKSSVHGKAFLDGNTSAAVCSSCHGTHNIKSVGDPESTVFPLNIVDTCMECHANPEDGAGEYLSSQEGVRAYENSIHLKALKNKGLTVSAACDDCHGSHKIQMSAHSESLTNRQNQPKTCAKCHEGIYQIYKDSIHGQNHAEGNQDVPVCTDCHGEHSIREHTDPESPVYTTNIAKTCSNCHEDETLSERYGFPLMRLESYRDTYHGIASSLGDTKVANCASCHGVHDIRSVEDPKSTVHIDNIPSTCGKCHPQAGKNFALGKVHVTEVRESNIGAFAVGKFYAILIGASVGGFLLFILTDLIALVRKMKRRPKRVNNSSDIIGGH